MQLRSPVRYLLARIPGGLLCGLSLVGLVACQPAPSPDAGRELVSPVAENLIPGGLQETPAPDGGWRPHWLERCAEPDELSPSLERCLGEAADLVAHHSGADAVAELEICRQEHGAAGLLDLALGQLYVIAGQGEPEMLPREGPAADVGDWEQNRRRLLGRAEYLLTAAGRARPDDGAVDFLLADVERARHRFAAADSAVWGGLGKCSRRRSVELLRRTQQLNRYPAKLLGGVTPEYPESALRAQIQGEVVLDLLIDPAGQVAQAVAVASPASSLSRAAARAFQMAEVEPAKVGKYPIWSWLRVTVGFNLE